MFNKKTKIERPGLDEAIDLAFSELKNHEPDTKEYADIVSQIERLYALTPSPKENTVSKDGLIAVAGNLMGIGMILSWERVHVLSSKAVGFVIKSRV